MFPTPKKRYIIAVGVAVALVQFLGIPGSWKEFAAALGGFAVALLAFLLKQEEIRSRRPEERREEAYVESGAAKVDDTLHV